ncbi:hypothetical protein [Campylobacter sp. CN_NA1]|uniref:hypothetical protein n=1 Tax=Campylobacter sp. CN_NA1 TaxID=2984150 RepID=UPI0022EA06EF|nr:hypothetical protein [Campylobacter sp. CN_NA1]MDA3056432.1 hypothetical protein [Campylobacter sp. CN_NA1]
MQIKDLKTGDKFKIKLWGSVKTAEFVKNNGSRCEILVGATKYKLSSDSEIVGVLAQTKKVEVAEKAEVAEAQKAEVAEAQKAEVAKPKTANKNANKNKG